MTRVVADWLMATATQKVMHTLASASPYFVGGCVRDALMGRATADIDICVRTPPQETMALAVAAGLGAYPTGIDHGVVTLTVSDVSFEVTTLRRDIATDGRRAVVAFATTLAEDAARRDFTINALYADAAGNIVDPTERGLFDLARRHFRFIGDADQRITEDYLRILRFFRFHAQFAINRCESAGLAACIRHADGLRQISRERILTEMLKLLSVPDPEPVLMQMPEILAIVMPGAAAFTGLSEVDADHDPDPLRRLAMLGGYGDLPLSRAQHARLDGIARARQCLAAGDAIAAVAYGIGPEAARDAALIHMAKGTPPAGDWIAEIARGTSAVCPITARDLIDRGHVPGPSLGVALKALETRWVDSDFRMSRAELLAVQS